MAKYIVVTGGVLSGIGKGIAVAAPTIAAVGSYTFPKESFRVSFDWLRVP